MKVGASRLVSKDRLGLTVAALLVSASVLCWIALLRSMPLTMGSMGVASLVSSVSMTAVGLFEALWVVGMAAMMFPAMIPIVVFYNRFSTRSEANPAVARAVGTPLLLVGYLAVYGGLGLAVYLSVYLAVQISSHAPALGWVAAVSPGAVLVVAGLYQLTPGKSYSLMHCISPFAFFTVHGRHGLLGSLKMGASHGEYCVACCWAYMLVMFAVALMSIPFMMILSVAIAFEKVLLRGALWFTRAIAVGLVSLGVAALLDPGLLSLLSAG